MYLPKITGNLFFWPKFKMVDTEDTDNYVQAAYVAHRTPGILSIKLKHQLIDAKRLCSEEISQSIISVHVISGCDHNSWVLRGKYIDDSRTLGEI